jgi:hypothetical protein
MGSQRCGKFAESERIRPLYFRRNKVNYGAFGLISTISLIANSLWRAIPFAHRGYSTP